jgi:hypothetical protein
MWRQPLPTLLLMRRQSMRLLSTPRQSKRLRLIQWRRMSHLPLRTPPSRPGR